MSICPVCGCKTDDIDFVDCVIEGNSEKVCSFCDKQLLAFLPGKEPGVAQIRWLDSCVSKDYEGKRDDVTSALKAIKARFSETEPDSLGAPIPDDELIKNNPLNTFMSFSENEEPPQNIRQPFSGAAINNENVKPKSAPINKAGSGFAPASMPKMQSEADFKTDSKDGTVSTAYVKQLENRVARLEKDLDRHKKMQMLKNVLEIVVAIILVLIIMIVFFASGLYDSLRSIMDMSGAFARVSPIINLFTGR